jgi:translation initiation factor IF-3
MEVQLVDPETGSLHPVQPIHSIKYDKTTHDLRMVSSDPPIVKLINLVEEAEKARESEVKMKMNRKTAFEDKEVQISWNSADGDLRHKLDIARGFLERGDRVHMVFAPKGTGAGVAEVSQARKEEMLGYFEQGMDDLGMKWRDELKTKSSVVVYWQASNQLRQEKRTKVNEAELAKRRLNNEKKEARRLKEEERKRKAAEKA